MDATSLEFRATAAEILKERFPWLATGANTRDVGAAQGLEDLYCDLVTGPNELQQVRDLLTEATDARTAMEEAQLKIETLLGSDFEGEWIDRPAEDLIEEAKGGKSNG